MCERYNGWANVWTWLVNLHEIINDEAVDVLMGGIDRDQAAARIVGELAADLDNYVDDLLGELGLSTNPFVADLVFHALCSVDWYELAQSYYRDWLDRQE